MDPFDISVVSEVKSLFKKVGCTGWFESKRINASKFRIALRFLGKYWSTKQAEVALKMFASASPKHNISEGLDYEGFLRIIVDLPKYTPLDDSRKPFFFEPPSLIADWICRSAYLLCVGGKLAYFLLSLSKYSK